jgi:WD40 repeat protein
MRRLLLPGSLALVLVVQSLRGAAPPAAPPNAAEVARLIGQLGDDDADQRKAAMKRLEGLGERVLPALRKTIRSGKDVDVRLRAAVVARAIQRKLWAELRRFEGHKGWVIRVVLTPDGKRAVSSGFDGLRLWDLQTGKTIRSFGAGLGGWGLYVSRDGKRVLCSAGDRSVRLYDLDTGKELQKFVGHYGEVWVATLSPDGKYAVTGAVDRTLRVWDVETGRQLRSFLNVIDFPRCAAWSPDGTRLAVGHFANLNFLTSRGVVRIWDFKTGKEEASFAGHEGAITSVAYSREGKRLVSSSFDKTVRLWDVKKGKEVKRFTHPSASDGAVFTPDGRRVVTCGWGTDLTVHVWDIASGKDIVCYEGHTASALCVAVTPDGKQALSGGGDGTLRLWRLPR